MQDRPVCFQCDEEIETNAEMVFEAPCGHDDCCSAVFHAACLFDWRDHRGQIIEYVATMRRRWMEDHGMTPEEET